MQWWYSGGSMVRLRFLFAALPFALAIAVLCPSALAQEASTDQPPYSHTRKAARRPMPFPPGSEQELPVAPLEFRPYDQMTQQDRDLAADGESSIEERAGFVGLEFNQGKWNYQQIVCPALPNHLLLQFTRKNGTGDVSVFSASIPRTDDGRVRIIPILRRGYSLFSPAPINALTISAFNHIRAEEHPANPPEWLATALCYAALAGAHPQIGPAEVTEIKKLPAPPPGRLVIPMQGGAVLSFVDVAAIPRPMQWTMTFNGKGKLLKATHSAAEKSKDKAVHKTPVEVKGKTVQSTSAEGKATLIQ